MRIFPSLILALAFIVLPGMAASCGGPAEPRKAEDEPPAVADSAAAWFAFHKFGRYADSTIGLFIAFDDGSGERVLTPADFAARPFPSNEIGLPTRTKGTLRVRTYLLDDDRDTLAIAAAELRLAPDTLWNVLVMPGAIFPAEGGRRCVRCLAPTLQRRSWGQTAVSRRTRSSWSGGRRACQSGLCSDRAFARIHSPGSDGSGA